MVGEEELGMVQEESSGGLVGEQLRVVRALKDGRNERMKPDAAGRRRQDRLPLFQGGADAEHPATVAGGVGGGDLFGRRLEAGGIAGQREEELPADRPKLLRKGSLGSKHALELLSAEIEVRRRPK
jgi:hypothetical protein